MGMPLTKRKRRWLRKNRRIKGLISIIYMLLATAMFFLQDTYFVVAGMELSLKNPCGLAILFLALINLIATVRLTLPWRLCCCTGRFRHMGCMPFLLYSLPLYFII